MRAGRVSALRRHAGSFDRGQRAVVGIEGVRAAEGNGLVPAGVAEGGAEDDRDVEAAQPLCDDLLAAGGILAWSGEVADDESLCAVERAAEQELGQETVEPVGRLVEVYEEDDGVPELGLQRGAAHRSEAGEFA